MITLADAGGIALGDLLEIDERNNPEFVDSAGGEGRCTYCGRGGAGQRVVGQFTEVKSKSGNDVTIDRRSTGTTRRRGFRDSSFHTGIHGFGRSHG